MCVIAVYEKNLKLNKEELKNCFEYNSDGAGFMYYDKNMRATKIKKGFFTFEEFWNEASKLPTNIDRVFHFRIATSGAISASTCHPFPVAHNYKLMGNADSYTAIGMVHNGVLHDYTPKEGMKAKYSDTMRFIKEMAYPLGDAIWNDAVQELLEEHIGHSKLVFLGEDKIAMLGDFQQSKKSGAWYSNSSYQVSPYKSLYSKATAIDTYGWYNTDYTNYDMAVEVFCGVVSEDRVEEFVGEMYVLCDEYGIEIYDWYHKEYSIVFYVDKPEKLKFESILGKEIFIGETFYDAEVPE